MRALPPLTVLLLGLATNSAISAQTPPRVLHVFVALADENLCFRAMADEDERPIERCIFKCRSADVHLVADAYEGNKIRAAVTDFLAAAAGQNPQTVSLKSGVTIPAGGNADLIAYVGHDAFMDFQIPPTREE